MSAEQILIDLSNYKDRVGAHVEPGKYTVRVDDAELAEARSGNPMVNLWLRIIGGEFDGQTIVDRLVITEKSMFRVVGFMTAIGLPTPKKRLSVPLAKFMNQMLIIEVADGEPYNGKVKSEVRGYSKVSKAAKPADIDEGSEEEGDEPTSDAESVMGGLDDAASTTDESNDTEVVDLDKIEL